MYTIGTHNQIALRREKEKKKQKQNKKNKNKNQKKKKKTYKFQFGSCNRHSSPRVTIFWKFSMHFSNESSFYEIAFGVTFSAYIENLRYGYANSATTILS